MNGDMKKETDLMCQKIPKFPIKLIFLYRNQNEK